SAHDQEPHEDLDVHPAERRLYRRRQAERLPLDVARVALRHEQPADSAPAPGDCPRPRDVRPRAPRQLPHPLPSAPDLAAEREAETGLDHGAGGGPRSDVAANHRAPDARLHLLTCHAGSDSSARGRSSYSAPASSPSRSRARRSTSATSAASTAWHVSTP